MDSWYPPPCGRGIPVLMIVPPPAGRGNSLIKEVFLPMSQFPHLLSPIQIGTKIYKNRVVNAPRGGVWNEDPGNDHADPEQLSDAAVKCAGGVAAYEVGETAVSPSGGRGANEFYGFDDFSDAHTLRYREYAQTIHDHGALALVELSHMGQAKPESTSDTPACGPVDCVNEYGITVTGMTEEVIARTCRDFADAAWFMKETGFDGVDIHCGHGWLLHQFFSPRYNTRTDRFGGSIENRARFAVMVCRAVRERCGKDFIIECRVSGDEHMEGGYTQEDMVEFCRRLEPWCDLLHISAGVYQKPMETLQNSTLYDAHGCNVELAAKVKAAVSVPVAVVGGINDPADAERWISQGKCDLVVLCRQLQADPNWVKKAENGQADQIRKCLRCMRCYPGPFEEAMEELHGEFPEGCSVNPYLLHFDLNGAPKAEQARKVLVVGGGVAGMQAAVTASGRGHKVTLAERSGQLGGILNFARDDADKYDLKALADSMAAEVRASGTEVLLNTAATEELMRGFDMVVLAVGSSPLAPPIPGLDSALQAINAYRPDTPVDGSVIILGGGLVGCETAVHLAKQGKTVTIIEMRDELAPDAYRLHKHKLRQLIRSDERITVLLETKCLSVDGNFVTVEKGGVTQRLCADTVIAALGMKANPTSDLEAMAERAGVPRKTIGDCKRARKIYDAIEEGFLTAMEL